MAKLSKSNMRKWLKYLKRYAFQGAAAAIGLLAIALILQHLLTFMVLMALMGIIFYLLYRSVDYAKFAI